MDISNALAELINLSNISKHHKKYCADPDCGVSLMQLKWTAQRLLVQTWSQEFEQASKLVEEMSIS